jgi:hypothetical protein
MTIKNLALAFALSLLSLSAAQAAPPANDSLLKAIKLTGNYSTNAAQDLSLATPDAMDPLLGGASAGKTLWYAFPHYPVSGTLSLSITSTTAIGTVSVFQVQDPENPRGSLTQASTTTLAAGQTITVNTSYTGYPLYLMLAGTGECKVTHRFIDVSYDFTSQAYELTGNSGSASLDNLGATNTADEPALPSGAQPMANIVWFKWTPTFTGFAYVDTNFSYSGGSASYSIYSPPPLHDTQIAIYSSLGGSADVLFPVVANDNGGYATNSRASAFVISGNIYYIAVGTVSGSPGAIKLQYYSGSTPSEIYFGYTDLGASTEGAESHPVIVRRRFGGSGTASCTLTTSNDTATAGLDYTSLSTTLNFADPSGGSNSAWQSTTLVTLLQDSTDEESTETVKVTLSANSPGSTLNSSTNPAHFFLLDDESGGDQDLVLSGESFRIGEGDTNLVIQVRRQSLVDASYIDLIQTVVGGDASYPGDFSLSNNSIFAQNISANISFDPIDDNVFEGDESVQVRVNAGTNTKYTVVIEDDDPYVPVAGKLTTALSYAQSSRQAVVFATVSSLGVVSGKVTILGQTLSFKGTLDNRGKLQVRLAPKGRGIFYLTLEAQDQAGHVKVKLLDTATTEATSDIALIQSYAPKVNPCPLAASYTLVTGGAGTVANFAAASAKIDVSGNAVIVGKLFDGTAFTAAGYVDGEAQMGAMTTLFAGTGCVGFLGEVPLVGGSVTSPVCRLNRPARAGDTLKIGAIKDELSSTMARYTPPAVGQRALEAWSPGTGKATLSNGPLMNTLTKALTISPTNLITAQVDAEKLKLTLVPSTGLFTGSFVLPSSSPAKTLAIYGALIDLPTTNGFGLGFFFDGLKGGQVVIGQP